MSKFLYPIYKLKTKSYIKWWLYHKKAGGSGVLSEILEGFSFNLENTLNRKFKLFEIEGNSVQNGTPSPDNEVPILSSGDNENLFDTSLLPITKKGVTISKDSKGNVVLNGTPTITSGYIGFDFTASSTYLKADTYTISVKNKIDGIGISINQTTPGGTINLTMSGTAKVKTGTLTADLIKGTMGVNVRYDVGTLENFVLNPKLEKSNKASGYSPYGMGSINEKITNADGTEEQDYSIFVQQPMRSIGDVRDCFVKKSDGWYERHLPHIASYNGETLPQDVYNEVDNVKYCNEKSMSTTGQFSIGASVQYIDENNWNDLPCTPEQIQQLENLPSTYKDFTIIQSEDETPAYLKIQYWKEVQS